MDPLKIIERFYKPGSLAHGLLIAHSEKVAEKALKSAQFAKNKTGAPADENFIREAAMLHDIGIFLTNAPKIGCFGDRPYICHGYLGREILEQEGLPRHALVAERHVGVGLTVDDIRSQGLPIPERDMSPRSIEEIIVCFADKFYSKGKDPLKEKSLEEVRASIRRHGEQKLRVFDEWLGMFE
ncbi:MAG: HDIG domain-containing protein [Nitrospiraceae bacterium]|nr:HDIG domain-containing protein [Nitrospiraceae bacterium]